VGVDLDVAVDFSLESLKVSTVLTMIVASIDPHLKQFVNRQHSQNVLVCINLLLLRRDKRVKNILYIYKYLIMVYFKGQKLSLVRKRFSPKTSYKQ